MNVRKLLVALMMALGLVWGLLWLLGSGPSTGARAAAGLQVCASGCGFSSIQEAVDVATPGEVIQVAGGVYTDVHVREGITQVVYISKTVTVRGGYDAVFTEPPDPVAYPTILDAQGQGRVLVVSDTAGVTLEGLGIIGGSAEGLGGGPSGDDAGGGVYAYYALSLTVTGCDVYSNSAKADWFPSSYGGGVYLFASDYALLEGNAIHHNWGNRAGHGGGGGLYLDRSHHLVLRDNVIHDNVGTTVNGGGGGMYVSDCDYALLKGNIVRDNFASVGADARGGGVLLQHAHHARVVKNLIQGNVATLGGWGYGGGVYIYGGVDVTLDGNVVVSNATNTNPASIGFGGSGLYVEWSDATFVNTVVADNWASAHGSGVYVMNGSPCFLHSTIARNGGEGGGVYVDSWGGDSSHVAMTNTILFSHTVGVTVTAGNTATLNGTLWHANNLEYNGNVIHVNDHSGDPAFGADSYHLTVSSAAIDQGVSAGVKADVDGEARPIGRPDVGADEWGTRVYLPLVLR